MKNIVFENVKKAYGKNVVVEDLCMEVKEGERLILLGPSGCGKSTLLSLISGLLPPEEGSILINGVPLSKSQLSLIHI